MSPLPLSFFTALLEVDSPQSKKRRHADQGSSSREPTRRVSNRIASHDQNSASHPYKFEVVPKTSVPVIETLTGGRLIADSSVSCIAVLRAQLLAATSGHQQQQRAVPHGLPDIIPNGSPSSSTHSQVIDPAIANGTNGSGMMSNSAGESGGDEGDLKKGQKRELSTSKRAAQNRAAQVSPYFVCLYMKTIVVQSSLS